MKLTVMHVTILLLFPEGAAFILVPDFHNKQTGALFINTVTPETLVCFLIFVPLIFCLYILLSS